jgi:ribosomal protein L7Ae-like RNA K-turn-binding protein
MKDPVLSMLGLAQKAGKVVSGEFATEKAVKEQKAKLVMVAEDASDNTKKLFTDKCGYYGCGLILYGTKETLGQAMGRQFRASLAICDENFAAAIIKKMEAAAAE